MKSWPKACGVETVKNWALEKGWEGFLREDGEWRACPEGNKTIGAEAGEVFAFALSLSG